MPVTIKVKSLNKSFGPINAVRGISFEVNHGECGHLGPNGAGKSTTMKIKIGPRAY